MDVRNFIKVFDNTNNPELIGSFIKYLNNQTFEKAKIVITKNNPIKVNTDIRRTETFNFNVDENNLSKTHWFRYWSKLFNMYLEKYHKETNLNTSSSYITALEALKYTEGGFYKPHTDYHLKFPRNVSLVYFLNNDYKAGELSFYNPSDFNEKYLTIEPTPGRLVMWPSNYLYPHSVNPVKKGTRFVLVSWIS